MLRYYVDYKESEVASSARANFENLPCIQYLKYFVFYNLVLGDGH